MIWAAIAVVIATTVAAAMSGGPDTLRLLVKAWKKGVKKHVKDEAREAKAQAIVAQAEANLLESYDRLTDHVHAMETQFANYNSPNYEPVIDDIVEGTVQGLRDMIQSSMDLSEVLTDEEVKRLLDPIAKKAEKEQKKADKEAAKKAKKEAKKASRDN